MTCPVPFCKGESRDNTCSDHGRLCDECGVPVFRTVLDAAVAVCYPCEMRAKGVKCVTCGSPWYYMTAWDGRHLCRMCTIAVIRENGWDSDTAKLIAAMKKLEEAKQERQKKSDEANAEAAELFRKLKTRGKPETEALFEDKEEDS